MKENDRKQGERALDKLLLVAALVLFAYGVCVFLMPISTKFSEFGIGTLCIFFGLIALGLRFQKYRFKLIAVVVGLSLIVPAYFIEFSLFTFSQLSTSPARQIEPRTKREYLFSVNRGDGFQNAIPSVPPSTQLAGIGNNQEGLLPLAGIANRFTVHCNENGYWMTYQADMHGFNNPNNRYWDGSVAVAVVGDSFAQGNCVQEGEDIASILRHRAEELGEVLNLGYGGNGPLLTLAVVREYVSLLRPAHVVWLFYEDNDADDLLKEAAHPLLIKYLSDSTFSQRLVYRQEEINRRLEGQLTSEEKRQSVSTRITRFMADLKAPMKLTRLRTGLGLFKRPVQVEYPNIIDQVFLAAEREIRSWGGELLVVYVPQAGNFVLRNWNTKYDKTNFLIRLRSKGLKVLDLYPGLMADDDPARFYPFRHHGHFNAVGYKLVGNLILDALEDRVD